MRAVRKAMPALYFMLLMCLSLISAQELGPASNDTLSVSKDREFVLITPQAGMIAKLVVDPLTDEAGAAGSLDQLKKIEIKGRLVLASTPEAATQVQQGNIAFMSCDPENYPFNIGAAGTITAAAQANPGAIVLYSVHSTRCSFSATNGFTYTSLYTTTDSDASSNIEHTLGAKPSTGENSKIILASIAANDTSDSGFTKSPTTAVAMIILYSITGIITALFLVIIVVGAIRAHRHPERYGPRHMVGRPRQSRAKGIARAMLETLPIVTFGGKEDKPVAQPSDVELGSAEATARGALPEAQEPSASGADGPVEDGVDQGPEHVKTETVEGATVPDEGKAEDGIHAESGLACSVCTDDFVKGQDIRVLPCSHKFHPECIDPWLLNVSGTCPLCRVDLRPTTTQPTGSNYSESPTDLSTFPFHEPRHQYRNSILNPVGTITSAAGSSQGSAPQPHRRSRTGLSLFLQSTLNRRRMRDATPAERIEALRTVRTANRARESESDASTEQRGRNRMSARLSRVFNSSSRPPSGVSSIVVPPVPDPADMPERPR